MYNQNQKPQEKKVSVDSLHPNGKQDSQAKFRSGNMFTESQALSSAQPLEKDKIHNQSKDE